MIIMKRIKHRGDNRDYNACLNLLAYPILEKTEPEYLKRICTTQAMA